MAKKSKKQNDSLQQSKQAKTDMLKKFGLIKNKINSQLPSAEKGFKPIDSDVCVLEYDEAQAEKAEQAMTEILSLLEKLKKKITEHEHSSKNYEQLSVAVEKQQLELNAKELEQKAFIEDLAGQKSRLAQKQKQLDKQANEQTWLQDQLEELQAEAENGFAQKLKVALENKRDELAALEREHNQKLTSQNNRLHKWDADLFGREQKISNRETNAESGFVAEQKNILQSYEEKKLQVKVELVALQDELDQHRGTLSLNKTQKEARQRSEREWKDKVKAELESIFRTEVTSLQSQLSQERKNRTQDIAVIADLQKELVNFKDLQRSLDNANIENIQDELNTLRQQNKELKTKLYSSDEDLEEKCEVLEGEVNKQRDKIYDLRQELEEAKSELHKRNLSTAAKYHLEKEKRILELHNQTLDSAIGSLKSQLDDLVERQQGVKVFPALSKMDQKYRQKAANLQPVFDLKSFADQLRWGMASSTDAPLYYREEDIRLFLAGLAMSNLHILQGMSGTGKTSLAKAFAKVVGGHCTDIAVQAGWRDKDDLLGHYNAFEKRFYESEALQALYRAQLPSYEDRINIILLDEMNLSRPEQYFADFNSALEKHPKDKDRNVVLLEVGQKDAPRMLQEGRKIFVPENVWFIGTANHDETTNEFADKTYDRAHVMELSRNAGKFSANNYEGSSDYSFSSLKHSFNEACNQHGKEVDRLLSGLDNSKLKNVLENEFTVSWTNRFERHAKRFIPVIKESGGSSEEGLDHLLATKLFRSGKVTGRFDISLSDLDNVSEALTQIWKELKLKGEPSQTLACIEKDRRRMERGA